LVVSVEEKSPAERAGVQEGDVLVEFDGEKLTGIDDLHRLLTEARVDRPMPMTLVRRAEKLILDIVPVDSR
jgi:S1-C subfamily serine protease